MIGWLDSGELRYELTESTTKLRARANASRCFEMYASRNFGERPTSFSTKPFVPVKMPFS